MGFIEVNNLRKEFRAFKHREGVWGAFRDRFRHEYQPLAGIDRHCTVYLESGNPAVQEHGKLNRP